MKIQTIPVSAEEQDGTAASPGDLRDEARVVMVKTSGPIDPSDAVLVRARQLVLQTNSPAMIDSFDWALEHGAFVAEK